MGLYSGGHIIGRIFASEILGAYFREGLLLSLSFFFFFGGGGLIMGILRYDLLVLSVVCRGGGGDIVLTHHAVSVHKQSKKELG